MIAKDIHAGIVDEERLVLLSPRLVLQSQCKVLIGGDDICLGRSRAIDHIILEVSAATMPKAIHRYFKNLESVPTVLVVDLGRCQAALHLVVVVRQQGDSQQAAIRLVGQRLAKFDLSPA